MNNYVNAVFVSYAWGGDSERTVDDLERAFDARGICIVRDKKDLAYKGSIQAFEQRIAQGQCIVLVISDKYLRSEHCMYELVEADKNQNLRERIFPIVLAEAKIYKAVDRLNYIAHWDEQIEQLNQGIKNVRVVANLSGITADLDMYTSIRASFAHLTDLLSDMNALTPEMHAVNGFSTLIDAVEHAMSKTAKTKQVELILDGKFDEFTSDRQQAMIDALAGLLRIAPSNIRILKVSQGSIAILLEMPDFAANRLSDLAAKHDFRIVNLGIRFVKMSAEFVDRTDTLWQPDPKLQPAYEHALLTPIPVKIKQVELTLGGEFGEFNFSRQQEMVGALAALLRIKSNSIQIPRVSRDGIVVMEMPDSASHRLYDWATKHDFRMVSLGIRSVKVEDRETVELRTTSIEFVNRAEELRQLDPELLRASDLSPFTQIQAPVGYGKSYLLQKRITEDQNNAELKSKWSICYLDFSEDVDNQRQLIQDRITGTLQQTFSVEKLCDHVINNLAGPYANGRRAVLLVLDSIEKLDLKAESYLIEFFVELFNRIHPNPNREIITVRVILSGRKVDEFWGKYEKKTNGLLAPNKVALTPFKEHAIEQLVARQASNLNIPLSAIDIKQIAFEVQYLSGGHPKIIRDLVDVLARRSFAIGSPRDYFSNHRVTLVENHVSPVANALLENIVEELRGTVCVLSTFRRLTANTISALIRGGLLSKEIQGIDLLEQMSKAHLLDSPKFDDPFYRDHLMQRVLALMMAHSIPCQDSYRQCNQVALELYEKLILQSSSSAISANPYNSLQRMQSPYFFVEWLYHALQDPQIKDGELRGRFDELALCSLGAPRSQADINLLKERIEQDFEIVYLARDRFKEGISTIGKWLNQP